jgi:hypothetical protein
MPCLLRQKDCGNGAARMRFVDGVLAVCTWCLASCSEGALRTPAAAAPRIAPDPSDGQDPRITDPSLAGDESLSTVRKLDVPKLDA